MAASATSPTGSLTQPDTPEGSSSLQPEAGIIHIQLIPHSDTVGRPALGDVVERKFEEGMRVRIGRQVIRDGQPTIAKGSKPPTDNDIWYASKVVSRIHAEMWVKDGQIYVKDIGSSSGTFLNKMRLSPSGKESRPYPLKEGDVLQFGIDYKGKPDDVYKSVMVRVGFYDQSWVQAQRRKANPARFRTALKMLLVAANPYASATNEQAADESTTTDCCICIGAIGPFQALFIAPCSHCYHYKCVHSLLAQSAMFQCPMCRQVANLAASVSMDSLFDEEEGKDPTTATADGTGRKMGQLRASDAQDHPDATISAVANTVLARLQQGATSSGGSGDMTPRNDSVGTPHAAATSPESATTSGRSTPIPVATDSGPRRRAQDSAPPPIMTATSPAGPTVKRRASITSKINALLRRGGGRDSHDDTPPSPSSLGSSMSPPPIPLREESLNSSQSQMANAELAADTDSHAERPSVAGTERPSVVGMKRNATVVESGPALSASPDNGDFALRSQDERQTTTHDEEDVDSAVQASQ
ncbi:hypothetical protein DFS34DRAFT_626469 [Phlyctochytrium arcticum]|nr:hypothetical protein DFS34DRAFT_626469 [Phlyctochytrium arcticum]